MTTYDGTTPSFLELAFAKASRARAQKRERKARASQALSPLLAFVRVMLHIAGFALLTIAAWQFNIIAGLAVAGVSCFALSTLMIRGGESNEQLNRPADPMARR